MNRLEILDWVRLHYGGRARPFDEALAEQVAALSSATGEGPFLVDYFEAAVNSADRFGRVKLVHVAKFEENASPRRKKDLARRRREDIRGLFARAPGFDAAPLERMYDAICGAGLEDFYPVASVEWDVASRRFEEVSLYCDERAAELARALAGGENIDTAGLFAVGYDFRPGKPSRFKLYVERSSLGRNPSAKPFLALPKAYLPGDYLVLRRRSDGGRFEETRKVYLSYLQRKSAAEACTVAALAAACAPGPLKLFLDGIRESARGQYLDYIGCEDGKFEAYFGKPAWGFVELGPLAGTGDRPGDLP
ncbi:MAG TPA: hypothetical protein VNI01_11795 [Elusimicrobiota bacterium]|nr:hypothetical protein [Elusimicrobiota bacterium]